MTYRSAVLFGLLTAAFASTALAAQDTATDRATLVGLSGVGVVVNLSTHDPLPLGVSEQTLLTDTELLLRQYGIPVLSRDQVMAAPGYPDLQVNIVTMTATAKSGSVFGQVSSIDVRLVQAVTLKRNMFISHIEGITWKAGTNLLVASTDAATAEIRRTVQDDVKAFINAYLAVNP